MHGATNVKFKIADRFSRNLECMSCCCWTQHSFQPSVIVTWQKQKHFSAEATLTPHAFGLWSDMRYMEYEKCGAFVTTTYA